MSIITMGEKLARNRKFRGYTLRQASDLTGFSVTYLSNIENNHVDPRISTLKTLCELYSVKLSELENVA